MTEQKITHEMLYSFRKDFEIAVKQLNDKYGLCIELGRISFCEDSFTGKISARLASVSPYKDYEVAFRSMRDLYDIPEDALGNAYSMSGRAYKFVGFDQRARSRLCVYEGEDGKIYKSPVETLKRCIEAQRSASSVQ